MTLMSQLRRNPRTVAPPSLDRHAAFIDSYFEWLPAHASLDPATRQITVIARSPASPVAIAVGAAGGRFAQRGVGVRAIFAELGADAALAEFCEGVAGAGRYEMARQTVRWARNACLRDAHEQLILGTEMCWSGDCMRREPGKCNALDLYENDAPQVVRLGMLAFDAIWAISEQVPVSRLDPSASIKPSAAHSPDDGDWNSQFSYLRRPDRLTPPPH